MVFVAALAVAAAAGLGSFVILRAALTQLERSAQRIGEQVEGNPVARVGEWMASVPVPRFWSWGWKEEDLESQLVQSGLPWSARGFHGFRWLAVWLALAPIAFLLIQGAMDFLRGFLSLALLLMGVGGPTVLLRLRRERRRFRIERALPDFLDRMTLGLEAGLSFELALRRASVGFGSELGEEIRRAVRLLDLGRPKSNVLAELAGRNPSQDLRGFATSVKQADRLGTSLAKTLRVQSGILRARRRRRAQEASRRLPVLVVFPLVFFFLPALLIIYLAPPLLHLFLR